jgi:hypothetical protein
MGTTTQTSPTGHAPTGGALCSRKENAMNAATVPTTDPVPTPRHPGWCSPSHCERTGTDVLHCSVPAQRATRDAHYTLALVAPDEDDFPAQRSEAPELALTVESATVVGDPVLVYLGADELPGLIDALTAHHHRARVAGGEWR